MAELRKAAVLLMSLPQDEAAVLMSKLEAKQVEAVSIEIAKLGNSGSSSTRASCSTALMASPA